MHRYLRAIGFSKYRNRREVEDLLLQAEQSAGEKELVQIDNLDSRMQTYTRVGDQIGISLCGILDEDEHFYREYYFPYMRPDCITTQASCQIQRHAEKESFAGICEEYKVGVSLIFYVQNGMEFRKRQRSRGYSDIITSVMMTGLSVSGKILLPVRKTESQLQKIKVAAENRSELLEAAKNGDESAMESLTLEDIDLFAQISGRVMVEDVYSIVDSCFMPYGVECDQYSIIGEIIELETVINQWTKEEIYRMTVICNDLTFQVGINKMDLIGEPAVGRRFKGVIWMQGNVNFMD